MAEAVSVSWHQPLRVVASPKSPKQVHVSSGTDVHFSPDQDVTADDPVIALNESEDFTESVWIRTGHPLSQSTLLILSPEDH